MDICSAFWARSISKYSFRITLTWDWYSCPSIFNFYILCNISFFPWTCFLYLTDIYIILALISLLTAGYCSEMTCWTGGKDFVGCLKRESLVDEMVVCCGGREMEIWLISWWRERMRFLSWMFYFWRDASCYFRVEIVWDLSILIKIKRWRGGWSEIKVIANICLIFLCIILKRIYD